MRRSKTGVGAVLYLAVQSVADLDAIWPEGGGEQDPMLGLFLLGRWRLRAVAKASS